MGNKEDEAEITMSDKLLSLGRTSIGMLTVIASFSAAAMFLLLILTALAFDPCGCGCYVEPIDRTVQQIIVFAVLFTIGLVTSLFCLMIGLYMKGQRLIILALIAILLAVLGAWLLSGTYDDVVRFSQYSIYR